MMDRLQILSEAQRLAHQVIDDAALSDSDYARLIERWPTRGEAVRQLAMGILANAADNVEDVDPTEL